MDDFCGGTLSIFQIWLQIYQKLSRVVDEAVYVFWTEEWLLLWHMYFVMGLVIGKTLYFFYIGYNLHLLASLICCTVAGTLLQSERRATALQMAKTLNLICFRNVEHYKNVSYNWPSCVCSLQKSLGPTHVVPTCWPRQRLRSQPGITKQTREQDQNTFQLPEQPPRLSNVFLIVAACQLELGSVRNWAHNVI